MDIKIELRKQKLAKPSPDQKLGFGQIFTDHMAMIDYNPSEKWHNPRIVPLANLSLHPACPVLHYSQEIFEGQKAYRRADGEILLFRPQENAKRMNESAKRMCMPELDPKLQLELIERLVDLDRAWVPSQAGASLYLRPTMISTGAALGAVAAKNYCYYVIASPSGSYYATGVKPVKIKIEDYYVRAVRGGTGVAKTGGNYASTFKATKTAQEEGYNQVMWLDAIHNEYCEEVGAMNMMFVINDKLITPPLAGSILPGITRKSILETAKDMGMTVEERPISVKELYAKHESNELSEAFGTGTAAVISPVGEFSYRGHNIVLNNHETGPVAAEFYQYLTDLQWGKSPDPKNWTWQVKKYQ